MTSDEQWRQALSEFEECITTGKTVEAIERFYAEDAIVFENRTLARAGRAKCAEWEREQCRLHASTPNIRIRGFAANVEARVAFWELTVRWGDAQGRMMRLEEVLVQRWQGDRISQERYYYEGVVDEGDDALTVETILDWAKRQAE